MFIKQEPRKFCRADILNLNEGQIGVYGIFNAQRWIYIGKGDIRTRMLAHLNGDNPSITAYGPTHFVGEVTASDPSIREKQLIVFYNPVCNKRVG